MSHHGLLPADAGRAALGPSGRAMGSPIGQGVNLPFLGLIEPVLVEGPAELGFSGTIQRAHAAAAWVWVERDLAADLLIPAQRGAAVTPEMLDMRLPAIIERMGAALKAAAPYEAERRLRGQLGGDAAYAQVPQVIAALRHRALIAKASDFGRAINTIPDEPALAQAIQSMPLQDAECAALTMAAMVRQVSNPSRLVTAAIRIAGGATEAGLSRAGLAPLIDALLAHAQNQIPLLAARGAFADADLACRAIDRYHRLVRAVSGNVELGRLGRWASQLASLTTSMSRQIEPKLRDIPPDVSQALRGRPEGVDRLDADRLLAALNGIYLLVTIKDRRASLALNTLFDQIWQQVGQMLELLLTRNLDLLRQDPGNSIAAARLESGIKMAELRFNADYADVLRRAKDAAERRSGAA